MNNHNVKDELLLENIKKNNYLSFDVLFRKYYPLLCSYASKFLDWEEAEDIVQEIMIWLWNNRSDIIIEKSLSSYLYTITYHKALSRISKTETRKKAENLYHIYYEEIDRYGNSYELEEIQLKIEAAIRHLPKSYQEVFIMSRYKNKTYKEIAKELNVSIKTIDYRICQALKLLREELKDYLPIIVIELLLK